MRHSGLSAVHHYHNLGPENHDYLVALFVRASEEAGAYIEAIKARPYRTGYQPKALPHLNAKSR